MLAAVWLRILKCCFYQLPGYQSGSYRLIGSKVMNRVVRPRSGGKITWLWKFLNRRPYLAAIYHSTMDFTTPPSFYTDHSHSLTFLLLHDAVWTRCWINNKKTKFIKLSKTTEVSGDWFFTPTPLLPLKNWLLLLIWLIIKHNLSASALLLLLLFYFCVIIYIELRCCSQESGSFVNESSLG